MCLLGLRGVIVLLASTSGLACLLCLQRVGRGQLAPYQRSAIMIPIVHDRLVALPVPKFKSNRRILAAEARHFMASGVNDDEDPFNPMGFEESINDETEEFYGADGDNDNDGDDEEEDVEAGLQKLMLQSIRWYKSALSPMMPPNCRFRPTCSSYGLESIKKFGVIKGGFLTAWRILRCTPFGGSGYDAPEWPPVGYRAGSNTKPWF